MLYPESVKSYRDYYIDRALFFPDYAPSSAALQRECIIISCSAKVIAIAKLVPPKVSAFAAKAFIFFRE
jgi:hypothetical protein